MERTRLGKKRWQFGSEGREDSKQILVVCCMQGFLLSQRRLDLTQLSRQLGLILESRIKRRATCRRTKNRGKSVLSPCSEGAGSPLATLNPHPIRVLLLMHQSPTPPEITLGSSTCSSTCLGICSEIVFVWMMCLSLMAQYPQPVWKLFLCWMCSDFVEEVFFLYIYFFYFFYLHNIVEFITCTAQQYN